MYGVFFINAPCNSFSLKLICNDILLHKGAIMQVLSSLKTAKKRSADCQIVRRRGKLFVICKSNPRFKARQG